LFPDSIRTSEIFLGDENNDGCYITSTSQSTDAYVTRIGANSEIFLESKSVTVGYYDGEIRPIYASSFQQLSDERLKSKISDITLTSEQISEAPAIIYHWNTDESKTRRVGTIAQYWQNILPEVVTEDSNGNLSLNYSELSAISVISLAKEIIELKKRIEELEK
jgi:hypothetical protein